MKQWEFSFNIWIRMIYKLHLQIENACLLSIIDVEIIWWAWVKSVSIWGFVTKFVMNNYAVYSFTLQVFQ